MIARKFVWKDFVLFLQNANFSLVLNRGFGKLGNLHKLFYWEVFQRMLSKFLLVIDFLNSQIFQKFNIEKCVILSETVLYLLFDQSSYSSHFFTNFIVRLIQWCARAGFSNLLLLFIGNTLEILKSTLGCNCNHYLIEE